MRLTQLFRALFHLLLLLLHALRVGLHRLLHGPARRAWSWRQESVVSFARWMVARITRRMLAGHSSQVQRAINDLRSPLGPLQRRVRLRSLSAGDVPGLRVSPDAGEPRGTMLYLHGGGYVLCSTDTHRSLMARLALAAQVDVVGINYRLGPQHPFPAAVDDAVAAYSWLAAQVPPERIVVAGDSAGGGLALALLLRLRDAGQPLPAAAVLLSPWVDMDDTEGSIIEHAHLDYLGGDPELLRQLPSLYLGQADPRTPLASPVRADLSGLPPLLLHAGGVEMLHDQVQRLAQRARQAGVTTRLEVWPEMVHVWHAFEHVFPRQAAEAVAQIGSFVEQQLTDDRAASDRAAALASS